MNAGLFAREPVRDLAATDAAARRPRPPAMLGVQPQAFALSGVRGILMADVTTMLTLTFVAGASRAEFIDELAHWRIPVVQMTAEELQHEGDQAGSVGL